MSDQKLQPSTSQTNMKMIKLLNNLITPLDYQYPDFSWNQNDSSPNISLNPHDAYVCSKSCEQPTTDCIRGKKGFTEGIHAWQIRWSPMNRGLYPIVGVSTQNMPLYANGKRIIVGSTQDSWGWDLSSNLLYHNSIDGTGIKYPDKERPEKVLVPETVTLLLDMEEGTLSYFINKVYLGIAFGDLRGLKLYPTINVTHNHAQITMYYMGGLTSEQIKGLEIV